MQIRAPLKPGNDAFGKKQPDRVYLAIKQMIDEKDYAPGEYVREEQLARLLGVSRTPVREAFRRLGAEGWLEIVPNRGVRIREWSVRDVEDIFDARALIEPYLSRLAVGRVSAAQMEELHVLAVEMREALPRTDSAKGLNVWFAANQKFHQIISGASGNIRLNDALNAMKEIPLVRRTFNSYDDVGRQRSVNQHFELIEAMHQGDADWVAAVMQCHILRAKKSVIDKLARDKH